MQLLHRSYKKYSGILIKGEVPVRLAQIYDSFHMWRAFYLTTQVESPKWGTVQGYDGAGISGGPFHYTACHPKSGKQGSLFSLLRRIELGIGTTINKNLERLWHILKENGWYVARDGKLRSNTDGSEINGILIRDTFSPFEGKVPKYGKNYQIATEWAILFHNLLSDKSTFIAQTEHAIDYLVKGQKSLELSAYQYLIEQDLCSIEPLKVNTQLNLKDDLAMCVYHTYSVNAPGPARTCLKQAIEITEDKNDFAENLIYLLGTSNYGRWKDTTDNRNRYDKTRIAATASGLWPSYILEELMPENLKQ